MQHVFDVLCIGSAKIDIFLSIYNESPYIHLDKDANELCVAYGQKIPINQCSLELGGNACNVAVGLSKLQVKTAVMAEIGKDEFAQKIINILSGEKVDTSKILQTEAKQSSFSTILSFKGERTIFSEHVERDHDFNFENISAKWIYLTSLGNKWIDAYLKAVDFAKKTNCRLAFNPGTLQIDSDQNNMLSVIALTDILFVNKEEAIKISNEKNENVNLLLESLQRLGPKVAVITDGANGSYTMNEKGEFFSQPAVSTSIIEKTGAGDAYASGFLAATFSNLPIPIAMKWGALNASETMTATGAQNGLLSREEMEKKNG
jgi:ribokinase